MKKCPFCGADIEDSARFCLYCMQSLTEKKQILPHKKKKPQWSLIIVAIVAIVSVSIIFMTILSGKNSAPEDKTPSDTQHLNSVPSSKPTEIETTLSERPTTSPATHPTTQADTQPATQAHIHSYTVKAVTNQYLKAEADCIYPAAYYFSCACGEKGHDTFYWGEAKGHTIAIDPGYPASCTHTGLTDGEHCSLCGTVFLAQTKLPLIGHSFDDDQDSTCNVCNYVRALNCSHAETIKLSAVAPTCITSGLTKGEQCALCQEILSAQVSLPPLGHTEVIDQAVAPTCTASGKTEGKHCATCNVVIKAQTTVSALGHTEAVFAKAVPATCTTLGKTEGVHCSVCKTVLKAQNTVNALGHTETVFKEAVPATCTTAGKTEGVHCSVCRTIIKAQATVDPLGHTEVVFAEAVPATCTSRGKTEGIHCAICKTIIQEQTTITALGHTPHVFAEAIPPTCTTPGKSREVRCSVCFDDLESPFTIPATWHSFSVGSSPSVCLDCGEYATLTIDAPAFPFVVNSSGFKKPFLIDWITYSLKPITDGKFYIEFTFYGTNISSEPALFILDSSLYGPNNASLSCSLCRSLDPNESGTYLAAAQIVDASGTYTLRFN